MTSRNHMCALLCAVLIKASLCVSLSLEIVNREETSSTPFSNFELSKMRSPTDVGLITSMYKLNQNQNGGREQNNTL